MSDQAPDTERGEAEKCRCWWAPDGSRLGWVDGEYCPIHPGDKTAQVIVYRTLGERLGVDQTPVVHLHFGSSHPFASGQPTVPDGVRPVNSLDVTRT